LLNIGYRNSSSSLQTCTLSSLALFKGLIGLLNGADLIPQKHYLMGKTVFHLAITSTIRFPVSVTIAVSVAVGVAVGCASRLFPGVNNLSVRQYQKIMAEFNALEW